MEVTAALQGRETITLTVSPSDLVQDLKALIHLKADIPIAVQVISFQGGKLSEDRKPLSHYRLQVGSQLTVGIQPSLADPQVFLFGRNQGDPLPLSCRLYDTVKAVKEAVAAAAGYNTQKLRLTANDEEMEDSRSLAYYNARRELQALLPEDFTVTVICPHKSRLSIVTFPGEVVAALKVKIEKKYSGVSGKESRLLFNSVPLEEGKQVSDYSLAHGATIYFDRDFEVNIVQAFYQQSVIKSYYFETIAGLKSQLGIEMHCAWEELRLFQPSGLLNDEHFIGETVAVYSTIYALKPGDVIFPMPTIYDPKFYTVAPSQESFQTVISRNKFLHIEGIKLAGRLLDLSQPLSSYDLGLNTVVQVLTAVTIQRVSADPITLSVAVSATVQLIKEMIESAEGIPLSSQRLVHVSYREEITECAGNENLRYYHMDMTLLLPNEVYLFVILEDKSSFCVPAEGDKTVQALKKRIADLRNIRVDTQILKLEDVEMSDEKLLQDYQVKMKTTLSLSQRGSLNVRIRTCDGKVTDYTIVNERKVRDVIQGLKHCDRVWFKYTDANIHLWLGDTEMKPKAPLSAYALAPGSVIDAKVDGEIAVTLRTGEKSLVTRACYTSATLQEVKKSFAYNGSLGINVNGRLFHKQKPLRDDCTLADYNFHKKCEIDFLEIYETMIVYIRLPSGEIANINLSPGNTCVASLKQQIIYKHQIRLHKQKLLFNGRLLSDSQLLETVGVKMWSVVDLLVVPESLCLWAQAGAEAAFRVGIRPSDSVLFLKEKISQQIHLPASKLRVAWRNSLLCDSNLVQSYALRNGCTLLVLLPSESLVIAKLWSGRELWLAAKRLETVAQVAARIERKTGCLRHLLRFTHRHCAVGLTAAIQSFQFIDYLHFDVALDLKSRSNG